MPSTPASGFVPRRVGIARRPAYAQYQRSHAAVSQAQGANLQPLPTPTGQPPYRRALSDIIGAEPHGGLSFHVIGDHGGVKDPVPQQVVAAALAADHARAPVSFCWSNGDVVYFNGAEAEYAAQFYEPYSHYLVPFMGVPGNHDGDPGETGEPSLAAYMRNFCSPSPGLLPPYAEFHRDTMDQPNCFWTLTARDVTIIGLYTNVPEGGEIGPDQLAWFKGELEAAPAQRPLVVSLHHPPFSVDAHHGGSGHMSDLLDGAFAAAKRCPDLVLSGHVHNYQRFTRRFGGRAITYLVVGASGYHNLHSIAPVKAVGDPPRPPHPLGIDPPKELMLESYCADKWGFLRLDFGPRGIEGEYTAVDRAGAITRHVDTFTLPLAPAPW